jgi:hypothetical protein
MHCHEGHNAWHNAFHSSLKAPQLYFKTKVYNPWRRERTRIQETAIQAAHLTHQPIACVSCWHTALRSVRPEAACRAPHHNGGTHMRGPLCCHSKQRASMRTARTQAGRALLLLSRCKHLTASQGRARPPAGMWSVTAKSKGWSPP